MKFAKIVVPLDALELKVGVGRFQVAIVLAILTALGKDHCQCCGKEGKNLDQVSQPWTLAVCVGLKSVTYHWAEG